MFDPVHNEKHLYLLIAALIVFLSLSIGTASGNAAIFLACIILGPLFFIVFALSYQYFTRSDLKNFKSFDLFLFSVTGETAPIIASTFVSIFVLILAQRLLGWMDFHFFGSYFSGL